MERTRKKKLLFPGRPGRVARAGRLRPVKLGDDYDDREVDGDDSKRWFKIEVNVAGRYFLHKALVCAVKHRS